MKNLKSLKIASNSLTERTHKDLRMAILKGEIPGGTRLVESALAERMGVSRTPIREALQRLALEGLVFSIPRAGYIVEEMSQEDIEDLFTTRMAIEQLVARKALDKITTGELDRLRNNLENTDVVIKGGRTEKMMDLDIEFHHTIYKASRSKTLFQISKTLSDHTLKFRMACIHIPEIARRAREDHCRIYEAIRSREADRVERSIKIHMGTVKKDIFDFLQRARQDVFTSSDFDF